jgi:hypothetical protein
MLNARSVIVAIIVLAFASIGGVCISMLRSPGNGGMGVDSYGTRAHGFRGLMEVLNDLHVPVERAVLPPSQVVDRKITLAFLDPNVEIAATEPAFLNLVGTWVRAGGCVVVAPSLHNVQCAPCLGLKGPPKSVLAELGLDGVKVQWLDSAPTEIDRFEKLFKQSFIEDARETADKSVKWLRENAHSRRSLAVHAVAEGNWAAVFPKGLNLIVPDEGIRVIERDGETPVRAERPNEGLHASPHDPPQKGKGSAEPKTDPATKSADSKTGDSAEAALENSQTPTAAFESSTPERPAPVPFSRLRATLKTKEDPQTVAAAYRVGQGTIVVIADPRLLQNEFLGQNDNAVLGAHLLADFQRPVVFDEFYHGLTVRGNPFWLLSRFPYGLLAATVLAATLLVGWRAARFLGPPLASRQIPRRTLAEYIDAMAQLLSRTQNPAHYILREIRSGLLWRIRHDFDLPPGKDDSNALLDRLEKRDPDAMEAAREAFLAIDSALAQTRPSATTLKSTFAKVSRCVPRSAL